MRNIERDKERTREGVTTHVDPLFAILSSNGSLIISVLGIAHHCFQLPLLNAAWRMRQGAWRCRARRRQGWCCVCGHAGMWEAEKNMRQRQWWVRSYLILWDCVPEKGQWWWVYLTWISILVWCITTGKISSPPLTTELVQQEVCHWSLKFEHWWASHRLVGNLSWSATFIDFYTTYTEELKNSKFAMASITSSMSNAILSSSSTWWWVTLGVSLLEWLLELIGRFWLHSRVGEWDVLNLSSSSFSMPFQSAQGTLGLGGKETDTWGWDLSL